MASTSPATIVVVEESAAAQELIDQALRGRDNHVLVTKDPVEALEVARRVRIDVLITDVLDWRGPTFVRHLRSTQPHLRVLYVSGRDGADIQDIDPAIILRRPFSLGELREAVATLMDRADAGS